MRTKTLLTMLTIVALSVMTACGGSAYDRADDVIDTAEGWYEDMHEHAVAIAQEYETRLEMFDCGVEREPTWPGYTFEETRSWSLEQRRQMDLHEYATRQPTFRCRRTKRPMREIHEQIVETAGMLTPEAFDATARDLRTRLASVNEEALTRILDNAETTEQAWTALNGVNVRTRRAQYITPARFEERRLAAAEAFDRHAENLKTHSEERARMVAEGQAIMDSWAK